MAQKYVVVERKLLKPPRHLGCFTQFARSTAERTDEVINVSERSPFPSVKESDVLRVSGNVKNQLVSCNTSSCLAIMGSFRVTIVTGVMPRNGREIKAATCIKNFPKSVFILEACFIMCKAMKYHKARKVKEGR